MLLEHGTGNILVQYRTANGGVGAMIGIQEDWSLSSAFLQYSLDSYALPDGSTVLYGSSAAVPEPGSVLLLAGGLGVIGPAAWRRRR